MHAHTFLTSKYQLFSLLVENEEKDKTEPFTCTDNCRWAYSKGGRDKK